MAAQAKHREAIVVAAARLFRRQGYAATGLAEILAVSGAPKGSLYHYFPEGKRQVGVAAMTLGAAAVVEVLETLSAHATGPGDLLLSYAAAVAQDFGQSDWVSGCPIATILLEVAPADGAMAQAGRDAFDAWAAVFERSALSAGVERNRARTLGSLAITAIEGGLIQSRAALTANPLLEACSAVAQLFDEAVISKNR